MEAFQGAAELGYKWLETDLHLTRDGEIVCLHDHRVDRTTDGSGFVWDLTLQQVTRLDAGYSFGAKLGYPFRGSEVKIPTLVDVVTGLEGFRLVVDLKQDGLEEPLAALIDAYSLWDRLIVGSEVDRRIALFRTITNGRVVTSTGTRESFDLWRMAMAGSRPSGAHIVQLPVRFRGLPVINSRTVTGFKRGGIMVHAWTVNRPTTMRRLLNIGVDGIITDRPDLLREVLAERGLWFPR